MAKEKFNPTKYKTEFRNKSYDRINIFVKKGNREILQELANTAAPGGKQSIAEYLRDLVEKDTGVKLL